MTAERAVVRRSANAPAQGATGGGSRPPPVAVTESAAGSPATHAHSFAEMAVTPETERALEVPGKPLEEGTRAFFEAQLPAVGQAGETSEAEARRAASALSEPYGPPPGVHHDLSGVRVHTGRDADASARRLGAAAYTVGRHIVFASGRYAPSTPRGLRLLAHELTHVLQPGAGFAVRRVDTRREEADELLAQAPPAQQPPAQPQSPAQLPLPRQDFVFIMGQDLQLTPERPDPSRFYHAAEQFYRTRHPGATFVTDLRTLEDLLSWVAANVQQPIGNLIIVSHANEDGTLSFALNAGDADTRIFAAELRDALHLATGQTALADVRGVVDAQTSIKIKGCDIGRTQAMVELVDEAFGGAGTVTAPTHEQWYEFDQALAHAESERFRAEVAAGHPMPPPVDPQLTDEARKEAQLAHSRAVAQRREAIQADARTRRQSGSRRHRSSRRSVARCSSDPGHSSSPRPSCARRWILCTAICPTPSGRP